MLIFEITKTNTPLPQKGLAPILIAPPHTYIAYTTQATISSVKQSKTKVTPCLHRTWAALQNTIKVIIISDAVYTGCCTAQQISNRKLLPHSIYDVLTQISNDFQRLRRGASGVYMVLLTYREETKQPCHPIACLPLLEFLHRWKADPIFTRVLRLALSFRRHFPLLFFYPPSLSFCRRSARLMSVLCTECSLLHIMSRHAPYCWLATSLFWYSAPTQFSKAFLKNYIPQL